MIVGDAPRPRYCLIDRLRFFMKNGSFFQHKTYVLMYIWFVKQLKIYYFHAFESYFKNHHY